jgi:arsenate reductase (thioredoxin)
MGGNPASLFLRRETGVISDRRTKVLFVCLGNSCRSPMAEGIAAHIASDILEVSSAGLAPLGKVQALTLATLERNGYPATELRSKPLRYGDLEDSDIIVNMSGRPSGVVFYDTSKVEDWAVEDPYGADAETYQKIFEAIEGRVVDLVARVRRTATTPLVSGNITEESTGPW